ncbi:MAG: hypothetical protein IJW46_02515 [Clostridia bacterium]|nr:hypothetical protein [Clostridia bacterium]
MKNILLIGVGGTGSAAVDALYHKLQQMGNTADTKITALVFDTDIGSISGVTAASAISMADTAGVGAVCDRLGNDNVSRWFPCDVASVRAQDLVYGASQWRKKSYLAFLNAMNKQASYTTFVRALEEVGKNAQDTCEVYVIASIAGGTGSGSFIPIALFAKRYLSNVMHRDPMVNAMIALPEIYEESQTTDNRVKIFANAYAILRELNAINLVARGYNREIVGNQSENKKAPIRFTIGSEKDRNVGVLFDASDSEFWTPKAAPFDQIFILDRMPGVHSIHAHNVIMANSLYAIIGTKMGSCFKTVQNNALTTLAQNNGGNAIYAGISTAELRFPKETILSYLAHEKAYRSCEEEWLVLHRATENHIHERERKMRERKKRFYLEDGMYASILLGQLKNQYAAPTGNVTDIVNRATALYEDNKPLPQNTADVYFSKLLGLLEDQIKKEPTTAGTGEEQLIKRLEIARCPGFFERIFKRSTLQATVAKNITTLSRYLTAYYTAASEFIRDSESSLADAILPFRKGGNVLANEEFSLVANLLMRDGKYIHPVAAMVQLCRMKQLVKGHLDPLKGSEWPAVTGAADEGIPQGILSLGSPTVTGKLKENKSYYYNLESSRLSAVFSSTDNYRKAKTDPYTDNAYLVADGEASLVRLRQAAIDQLTLAVFTRINTYLDGLIKKYREFFSRFEEARGELAEALKTEKHRDDGRVDSVLNIYSSVADKESIYDEVDLGGEESPESVAESDNVSGDSVFRLCYDQLARDISEEFRFGEGSGTTVNMLFDNMVKNYEKVILDNAVFKELYALDVFSALKRYCLKNGINLENKLEDSLQSAIGVAQPSLVVDTNYRNDGTVQPSQITVAMISVETARHLYQARDQYGITVSPGITIEQTMLETCAEIF